MCQLEKGLHSHFLSCLMVSVSSDSQVLLNATIPWTTQLEHLWSRYIAVKGTHPMQRTWYNVEYVIDVTHFWSENLAPGGLQLTVFSWYPRNIEYCLYIAFRLSDCTVTLDIHLNIFWNVMWKKTGCFTYIFYQSRQAAAGGEKGNPFSSVALNQWCGPFYWNIS